MDSSGALQARAAPLLSALGVCVLLSMGLVEQPVAGLLHLAAPFSGWGVAAVCLESFSSQDLPFVL